MTGRSFWVSHERGFYFRICGYGLSFAIGRWPTFGERHGYRKVLRIGRLAIEWLTPAGLPSELLEKIDRYDQEMS